MVEQLSLDSIPDEPEDWHAWIQWLANPVNNPQMRKDADETAERCPSLRRADHT